METSSGQVLARLRAAREKLEAKDLGGAMAIYEEVLPLAGERADVLVTISGDLGSTGHVAKIIELIAPRYDARRHGPATGFNLLQAYLAVRDPGAAQHVLDLLFDLNRPELEERLYGFSNAIADLLLAESTGTTVPYAAAGDIAEGAQPMGAKVGLVTISKPVWFYGLEAAAAEILPPKNGKLRRIAFAQLALPGAKAPGDPAGEADAELAVLSGAIPAFLADLFYFTPAYQPYAAAAFLQREDGARQPMIFAAEWTTENLRQLVDTTEGGLDYIFTGAVRQQAGDYELVLRLWEVRKFRERKVFSAKWTPATANAELEKLRDGLCHFMEWTAYPPGAGLAYAPPADPRGWLDAIGASANLFLADKKILPKEAVGSLRAAQRHLAQAAAASPQAALVWLTLRQRAEALGLPLEPDAPASLADAPAVRAALACVSAQPA